MTMIDMGLVYLVSFVIVTLIAKLSLYYEPRGSDPEMWVVFAVVPVLNTIIATLCVILNISRMVYLLVVWVPEKKIKK